MDFKGKLFDVTLAIDFDGTLCEHTYPNIGEPIVQAIETLKRLRESKGVKLILWTCREGIFLERAVQWCHKYGLFFDAINTNIGPTIGFGHPKICADLYLDDRSPGWRDLDDVSRWNRIAAEVVELGEHNLKNVIRELTP